MHGLHLTADLYDCRCNRELLLDTDGIAHLCNSQVVQAQLTIVGDKWVKFPDWNGEPGGVTGMVLLAESHLAIHTWPETGNVTLDVYVCNFSNDNSERAQDLIESIIAAYQPQRVERNRLVRGDIDSGGSFQQQPQPEPTGWAVEHITADAAIAVRARSTLRQATEYQSLELLETETFGRTLRLDGRFMTSEKEEFFYHEAMVHPAATAHPDPRRCLIIGGGDGGAAEELLKHPSLEQIVVAELDEQVIEVAREHLQHIHKGAFDDPRVQVHLGDGLAYLDQVETPFDLVLMDLTDPDTPASALYSEPAFRRIRRALAPDGALVLHLGSPVFHAQQVRDLLATVSAVFEQVSPFGLYTPLYGGYWGLAVASQRMQPAAVPAEQVAQRLEQRQIGKLQYYNAATHGALFALPGFYADLLA